MRAFDPRLDRKIDGLDLAQLVLEAQHTGGATRYFPSALATLEHVKAAIATYQKAAAPRGEDPILFDVDYFAGVAIKGVFTATVWYRVDLFDRDAGPGSADAVIAKVRAAT